LRDVLVGDPESVDAVVQSSNRVFMIAKKTGQTNAFFFDTNGQQVLTLEIAVGADLSALDDLLRRLLPGSNIRTELAGSAIALTGSVRSPIDSTRAAEIAVQFAKANADQLQATASSQASAASGTGFQSQTQQNVNNSPRPVINLLAVEGEDQVMLRVQVAEVQRSVLKQLGVNLGATISTGNFTTSLLTENKLPLTAAAGLGGLPLAGSALLSNSGIGGTGQLGSSRINHVLRAMERDGLVRTLAEPNLTAVSGETANFLAGGEYPVPVGSTRDGIAIEFKKFGVGLAFTPIVMSEGRISLKIETEVSELTDQGAVTLGGLQIPALKKRTAKSTVELPSGGSLAMAGLISESLKQNMDGLPGLKDVPVLGTLFRSREFIKEETELVIIVTPFIVRPTSAQNLARPVDGLAPATDMKANFLGHLNKVYGKGTSMPDGDLKGDHGFIVE
jgi:pilus assembly protein CpaC